MQRYWDVCIAIIAQNPFPRHALWVERVAPIANIPGHTYLYEIAQDISISGERVLTFTAEFFPWHVITYIVDEDANDVIIIFLRENHRV